MASKLYKICLRSTSKTMVKRKKKRGRWKYKNLDISRMKRALLMREKMSFILFETLSCGEK